MNQSEHNQLGKIHSTVTHLDKRVTILETRADAQANAISSIQSDVKENKALSTQILGMLTEDARSRTKVAWGVALTLLAAVGTLITVIING